MNSVFLPSFHQSFLSCLLSFLLPFFHSSFSACAGRKQTWNPFTPQYTACTFFIKNLEFQPLHVLRTCILWWVRLQVLALRLQFALNNCFLASKHVAVTTSNDNRHRLSFSLWPQESFSGWKSITVTSLSTILRLPSPYARHSASIQRIGLPIWFFAITWSFTASHYFLLPGHFSFFFFSPLPPTCTKATWRVCF